MYALGLPLFNGVESAACNSAAYTAGPAPFDGLESMASNSVENAVGPGAIPWRGLHGVEWRRGSFWDGGIPWRGARRIARHARRRRHDRIRGTGHAPGARNDPIHGAEDAPRIPQHARSARAGRPRVSKDAPCMISPAHTLRACRNPRILPFQALRACQPECTQRLPRSEHARSVRSDGPPGISDAACMVGHAPGVRADGPMGRRPIPSRNGRCAPAPGAKPEAKTPGADPNPGAIRLFAIKKECRPASTSLHRTCFPSNGSRVPRARAPSAARRSFPASKPRGRSGPRRRR